MYQASLHLENIPLSCCVYSYVLGTSIMWKPLRCARHRQRVHPQWSGEEVEIMVTRRNPLSKGLLMMNAAVKSCSYLGRSMPQLSSRSISQRPITPHGRHRPTSSSGTITIIPCRLPIRIIPDPHLRPMLAPVCEIYYIYVLPHQMNHEPPLVPGKKTLESAKTHRPTASHSISICRGIVDQA